MEDLTSLVRAAQAGDEDAFDQLVRSYQARAVGYAYSLLGDYHRAEDAAQDAFLLVFQEIRVLREPSAFPHWLRRIVAKCCDRMTRRKYFHASPIETAAEIPDASTDPALQIEITDRRNSIHDAIRELPEKERTPVVLYYFHEHTQAQIADYLEISVDAVKKRLQRAGLRLQERMILLQEHTAQPQASAVVARFAEAAKLRRRIMRMLEQDSNVVAAYLAHFGEDEGFGTDDDVWSSLNIHVVLSDDRIDAMASERRAFARRLEAPLVVVEGPQNAPPSGYYLMALYDGEAGPYEIDWYWHPSTGASLPGNSLLLLDRSGLPSSAEGISWAYTDDVPPALAFIQAAISAEEKRAEETRNLVSLFWAMLLITAKYVARNPYEEQMGFLPMLCDLIQKARRSGGITGADPLESRAHASPSAKLALLRERANEMEFVMRQIAPLPDVSAAIIPAASRFLDIVEANLRAEGKFINS